MYFATNRYHKYYITETNNQTINHIDNNYLDNDKIATIMLHPTPSKTDNYLWIPEVSDNVAPGLDSLSTYNQSKYATLTALQNARTNVNNNNNIQTEIHDLEIPNK